MLVGILVQYTLPQGKNITQGDAAFFHTSRYWCLAAIFMDENALQLKSRLLARVRSSDHPLLTARDAIFTNGLPFPRRIILITDGNGRWAQQQQTPVPISEGHRRGAEATIAIVRECYYLADSMESILLWMVSPDNIANRDPQEMHTVLNLAQDYLQTMYPEMCAKNVRFIHLGSKEGLPQTLINALTYTEAATKENTGIKLVLALNYNGDQEDYNAVTRAMEIGRGITRQEWLALRNPHGLSQADLIIRPGGEQRLSNMGWIATNGELVFSPILMPDYSTQDFAQAFIEYAFRQRRGGGRPSL
jgi:undecaprenyl diphosphate synthase